MIIRFLKCGLRKSQLGPGEGRRLQELAEDPRSCKETLETINKHEEIDTRRSIIKIVERLPQFLQGL